MDTRFKRQIFFLVLGLGICLPAYHVAGAEDHALKGNIPVSSSRPSFFPDYEILSFRYVEKDSLQPRSFVKFITQRTKHDSSVYYKFTSQGEGDYADYADVVWASESTAELRDGILYPLESKGSLRYKGAQEVIVKKEKYFDYAQKQIRYTSYDGQNKKTTRKIYPLKGLTVDSATLPHVLRSLINHDDSEEIPSFYIMTEADNFYHVTARHLGEEELLLADGPQAALKIQLIPRFGPLSWLGRAFVPPTYMWFSLDSPYDWLQYQGYEIDFSSLQVIGQVINQEKKLSPPEASSPASQP